MELIQTTTDFECLGEQFSFKVKILVDTVGSTLRFNFTCRNHKLPPSLKNFDVVATFHRHILFNKLAASEIPIEKSIILCVTKYINNVKHARLPAITDID